MKRVKADSKGSIREEKYSKKLDVLKDNVFVRCFTPPSL
jgi:hypothetical protein